MRLIFSFGDSSHFLSNVAINDKNFDFMPTSIDSSQINELAVLIADRLFIQVGNWNLYLGDAGLAKDLAIECQANFEQGANVAAKKGLEAIQVKLGGGTTSLPLSRLIPSNQLFDLEEILEPYCR